MSVIDAPSMGDPHAPVTVVEFTDYQCPFCGRHAQTTLIALRKRYVETGRVRYVVRDLPLSIHPTAQLLAHAARCVAALAPGKFPAFHDSLFAHQRGVAPDSVYELAAEVGVPRTTLEPCARSTRFDAAIAADQQAAEKAGFSGTPSFVFGRSPAGDAMRGVSWTGAFPLSQFESVIDSLLAHPASAAR